MIKKLCFIRWFCWLLLFFATGLYAQNGLHFAGGYVQTTYGGITGLAPRTSEAWIKVPTDNDAAQKSITDWGTQSTNSRFTLCVLNNLLRIEAQGTTNFVLGVTPMNDGLWHHVAVTYNPAINPNTVLYIDGVPNASGNLNVNTTTGTFKIGSRTDLNSKFYGNIDEVRIWNVARTQAEIQAAMFTEFCTIPASLKAYFKLNQGVAEGDNTGLTSVINAAGTGNGTLTGFALSGTTSNWVGGKTFTAVTATTTFDSVTNTISAVETGTYQWVDCNNGNTPVTGATSNTFTPTYSSSFAVTVSQVTGCSVTSACTPVTVTGCNINPTVTLNNTTLTAVQNGASYQWIDCNNSNTPISGATAASFTPTISGNYAVIITTPDTCTLTTPCTYVCALAPTVALSGTTLTATPAGAAASANATYQWVNCANGNAAIAGATSASFTPTIDGNYAVVVTTSDNCTSTSACTQVTLPLLPNGLAFDATNDYVQTSYTGITGTNPRTVEAWIKVPNNNAAIRTIVDWGSSTTSTTSANRFALVVTAANKLQVSLLNSTTNGLLAGTTTVADGNWHHVAVTYDAAAANKYILYLDGVQEATGSITTVTGTTSATGTKVRIGYGVNSSGYFNGTIDEVRIWDVVRTQAEIAGAMNTELCTIPSSLKAYYKFNKGAPASPNAGQTSAPDSAGTNPGTLTNFALTGATSNWVAGAPLTGAPTATVTLAGTTLTVNTTAGATYQWVDCGNSNAPIASETAVAYTPTVSGNYAVIVTGSNGCTTTSACTQVTIASACTIDNTVTLAGTTLTATQTGATYQWVDCANSNAPISGATTAAFTPTVSGNYAVEITMGAGCTATSTCTAVTVCNVNNAVTLAGTTLTATQAGASSYQWVDCADNSNVSGATSQNFTPTVSGSYKVVITQGTCTATSACTSVTICNVNNAVTLAGTTLTATQAGASSYQWVDCADNSNVSGATSQNFTPTVSGSYKVVITQGTCTATSACTSVTICNVNNAVTLAGTTLTATQAGASYQWVDCSDDSNVSGATSQNFTPTASGSYKVVITQGTCTATSACTSVTICNVNNAVTLAGTTLTATQTGASYQWVDCANSNAPVSGATSQAFTPAVTGNYAVVITMPNSCTATSVCTSVTIVVCSLDNTVTVNNGIITAAQAGATYQWVDCADNSNISGATNATYTPTVSGSYKVVITAGTCTATSACTAVTVCNVNNAVTLAGTTLTATQSGATYQWVDCADNTNISGATTQNFTPSASGNYKVVITQGTCTATSACTAVTVCNVNNAVTLAGTTLTATQAGATYQWVDCADNTNISGATTQNFTPTASGNYKVVITQGTCTATSACTSVTICNLNNAVTLAGTTLTATQAGATYQWVDCADNTNISGATTQNFTPTASGNYKVVITQGTCTATSACTAVTVCNLNNAVTLAGTTLTATQAGATYQWVDCADNSNVSGATTQNFTPTVSGNYKVVITQGACTATSACTSVTIPVGPTQNALHFDASNDFVMTAYSAISGNASRTVEAWIKIPADNAAERMIVDWGSSTARFGLSVSSANKLKVATSGSTSYTAATSIADGNWHHVAVTYDSSATSNKIKLYVDGVQDGTASPISLSTSSTLKVRIGYAITDQFIFNGFIDEVRIWDVARTQAEIAGSKDIELCTVPTSLKAYYKFNQGVAAGTNTGITTLTDTAGTNNGTLMNFGLTGATSNWVTGAVFTGTLSATATLTGTTLTANTVTGATYQWVDCANSNAPVPGATAVSFTPPVSGNYAVIISGSGGCTATSACVQVTVTGCNLNSAVTLTGTTLSVSQPGATFQWVNCATNANISGATAATYTPTVSGNYKVVITAGSCTATSTCTQVTIPVIQNALHFNFTTPGDYVETTFPGISGSGARTIEAWINVPANNAATRFIAEWGTGTSTTTDPNKFGLYVTSANLLQVTVTNGYNFPGSSTVVADGTWHHVAVTFDNSLATDKLKLYIDGVLATSGNPTVAINTGTAEELLIGRGVTGSGLFNGTMDELRVWNVARTQAELQANMNSEFCTVPSNLVAYYNFNQGVAGGTNTGITTLLNSAGPNNGTLMGTFTLTGATSNFVTGAPGVASGVVPTATVALAGSTLTANTVTGATYQWVNCDNANAPVVGATSAAFTPSTTGNYAVMITAPGGCSALSACTLVTIGVCTLNPAVTVSGSTLTAAQAGATYQWIDCNNGNAPITGATAISYTPAVSGNYAVIITAGAGCTITSACTAVCVVNPTVTLAGTTLTATQAGATYQWINCADNTNISGATAQTYTPTVSGSYKVTITLGSCTVTSACTAVCVINSGVTLAGTTLTATQAGATYQWVNCTGNTNITGATSQTYTPTTTGSYKVIVTMGSCTVTTACTQVCVINPGVTLNGNTLLATQAGTGVTYQWVNCTTNANIAGATSQTYTPAINGNYKVIITIGSTGCTTTSACTEVTVCNPSVAVTISAGTLTAVQTGATYQWLNCATGNSPIAGATQQSFTPTVTGNYAVVVTMAPGCSVTSGCSVVIVCNVNQAVTQNGNTLTATQTGASYQWINCNNNNTAVAGATQQSFTPTVTGNYAVIITMSGGCTAISACTDVCVVNPAVTLAGTTLTATQAGATYQWIDCADNTNITGATAQTFTPTVGGSYKVVITMPNNCTTTSACTQVCIVDASVTLNGTTLTAAQAGASYQWINCANNTPVPGAASAVFTPTVSGNYKVVITMPNNCTATSACTQVTVCNLNDAVTLNGTTLSVAQAGASYQWINCADNTAITGANAQTFTPTASGSYAVIISTPNNCTTTSACTVVDLCNVNAGVNNNAGTLMAFPQTGATYQWIDCANNNTPITGATAINFTPTVSGNYGVIVTIGDCTATSQCQNVVVCNLNDTVTLNGTTLTVAQAGASYQWVNCADDTAVAGANAQTFTPTVSGSYAVIISTPDNCTATSDCHDVCIIDGTVVNNGGTLTAVQTGATYQWINCEDNTPIDGATNASFTPTATGNYAVQVWVSNNCTVTSECEEVLDIRSFSPVGSIRIYPNPTSAILNLANAENLNIEKLTVTDLTGKVVLSQSGNAQQIDVQRLPEGVYLLDIIAAEGVQHIKFIKH